MRSRRGFFSLRNGAPVTASASTSRLDIRRSGHFFRFLQIANLGVHLHVLAAALDEELPGLEIVAFHRELRRALELVRPFAERVTEPRRFGPELGQAQLLPDYLR